MHHFFITENKNIIVLFRTVVPFATGATVFVVQFPFFNLADSFNEHVEQQIKQTKIKHIDSGQTQVGLDRCCNLSTNR